VFGLKDSNMPVTEFDRDPRKQELLDRYNHGDPIVKNVVDRLNDLKFNKSETIDWVRYTIVKEFEDVIYYCMKAYQAILSEKVSNAGSIFIVDKLFTVDELTKKD